MNAGLETFAHAIVGAQGPDDVWSITSQTFEDFGFLGTFYAQKHRDADVSQSHVITTQSLDPWRAAYFATDDYRQDPLLSHNCPLPNRFKTGIAFQDKYPFLTPRDLEVMDRAESFGFRSGVAFVMARTDVYNRGWNLMSRLDRSEIDQIYREFSDQLYIYAALADAKLAGTIPTSGLRLSGREAECLCWLSQGLRTGAIADKMGLKPVTVELHLRNARRRLGAKTREQALAIAITAGLVNI